MERLIQLKPGIRPDNIPCSPVYFVAHLQGKNLRVVKEYRSMVRAMDQNGEIWSLFNGQFNVVTGL